MKEKLSDEIREIIKQIKSWLTNEAEYIKLTLAEKLTIFFGTLAVAGASFLLITIALIIFSLCIAKLLTPIIGATLAFLCVGGIFIIIAVLIIVFRKQLIFNPLARMISKLLIDKKS